MTRLSFSLLTAWRVIEVMFYRWIWTRLLNIVQPPQIWSIIISSKKESCLMGPSSSFSFASVFNIVFIDIWHSVSTNITWMKYYRQCFHHIMLLEVNSKQGLLVAVYSGIQEKLILSCRPASWLKPPKNGPNLLNTCFYDLSIIYTDQMKEARPFQL